LPDVERSPGQVDVIDIQGNAFCAPQATPIQQLEYAAIPQIRHRTPGKAVEDRLDLSL
jgi:hypothetical protein